MSFAAEVLLGVGCAFALVIAACLLVVAAGSLERYGRPFGRRRRRDDDA